MEIQLIRGPDVELFLDGGAGAGVVDTKIRRFTTAQKNTLGNYATYADNANNACRVTVNIPGVYFIHYSDACNAGNDCIGISVNCTTLTTGISGVTYANGRRAIGSSAGSAGYICTVSTIQRLVPTDVIRPHFTAITGSSIICTFRVVRIGD